MKNLVSTLALSTLMVCGTAAVFAQSSSVGAGKENQQGTTMDGTGTSSGKMDDATKHNNDGNTTMKHKHHHKKMSSDSSNGSMSSGSGSMGSAGAGSSAGSTPAPQ